MSKSIEQEAKEIAQSNIRLEQLEAEVKRQEHKLRVRANFWNRLWPWVVIRKDKIIPMKKGSEQRLPAYGWTYYLHSCPICKKHHECRTQN